MIFSLKFYTLTIIQMMLRMNFLTEFASFNNSLHQFAVLTQAQAF